jgi:hypothetical protein
MRRHRAEMVSGHAAFDEGSAAARAFVKSSARRGQLQLRRADASRRLFLLIVLTALPRELVVFSLCHGKDGDTALIVGCVCGGRPRC